MKPETSFQKLCNTYRESSSGVSCLRSIAFIVTVAFIGMATLHLGAVVFFLTIWAGSGQKHSNGDHYSIFANRTDCNGRTFTSLKDQFLREGYVVFRSCTLKESTVTKAAKFTSTVEGGRVLNAYMTDDSVLDIAVDPDTLHILGLLNGRPVFPFQTLNFPVATQQATHSDVVHFDTLPKRGLMTAAWVALEDIHPDAGPLVYYPGSHHMGLWDMDELGVRVLENSISTAAVSYPLYERRVAEAIQHHKLQPAFGVIKKGETFIWAASLLHGGSVLKDPVRTRRSQVTHYFLVGAKRYWVPRLSVSSIDRIVLKCLIPSCAPSKGGIADCAALLTEHFRSRKEVDVKAFKHYGVLCSDAQ